MTGFDLTCWHCGGQSFFLDADEHGNTRIVCVLHEEHVEEIAAEAAAEAEGETSP